MNGGGGGKRTGKEDTTLFYCKVCDWEREEDRLAAAAPLCPVCDARLFWIAYERSAEVEEARAIVTRARVRPA